MTGHHPFNELIEGFCEPRKARVAARVAELQTETALQELRQACERSQEDLARNPKQA